MTRVLAALLLAGVAASARAQSSSDPHAEPEPEPICRNVRCVREPLPSGDDSPWLLLARAALAPLRLAFRTATELLLIAPRVEDEHHVSYRVRDMFFDDARVFGVYPTAFYETGFEPNGGVRMVHRDLFGHRERLQLRAGFGGVHNQIYGGELRSGRRWSPVELWLEPSFRWRDDGFHFYGVGNADLGAPADTKVAPDERAIDSEYGKQELRVLVGGALRSGALDFSLRQLWRRRELSPVDEDEPSVGDVYEGDSVAVFDRPLLDLYDELRVSFDGLRVRRANMPDELPSSGVKLTAWTGAQHEIDASQLTFGRVGLDLQPSIDLYHGDRVLHLRLRTAWVIGPLSRIPFLDLPQLGGASLLRGYDGGRFRGRGTVLASVEYRYPVQQNISGYLFVDGGRAFLQVEDVQPSSLRGARLGFGGGIYAFTGDTVLLRVQLASSIDGGLHLVLRLDTADALGDTY